MRDDIKLLKCLVDGEEIKLWEILSVEEKLRWQIGELEYALESASFAENTYIYTAEENEIFDSIVNTVIEYETRIWQLLETKTIFEAKLKLLRSSRKLAVKVENIEEKTEVAIPRNVFCKPFSSELQLHDHMSSHTKQNALCDEKFVNASTVDSSVNSHSQENTCSRSVLRKRSFIYTGGKRFECYLCHMKFWQQRSLSVHFLMHSNSQSFACTDRDLKLVSQPSLNAYLCNTCGNAYRTASGLRVHLNKHTGEQKFVCTMCDTNFTQKQALQRHMRLHASNKNFKCNAQSAQRAAKPDKRPSTCTMCSRKYANYDSLRVHMKRHLVADQAKQFQCTACRKSFHFQYQQQLHYRRIHERERPYECTECNERFFNQQALRTHGATHRGIREFACGECNGKFFTAGALKKHQITHSDARPYKCDQCGGLFKMADTLRRHLLRHSMQTTCTCEVCGAQFADVYYIKVHMRIHTGEKPFACSVCDRRFMDERNMKKHMKMHSK